MQRDTCWTARTHSSHRSYQLIYTNNPDILLASTSLLALQFYISVETTEYNFTYGKNMTYAKIIEFNILWLNWNKTTRLTNK